MRISDWSSDVCSSDLVAEGLVRHQAKESAKRAGRQHQCRISRQLRRCQLMNFLLVVVHAVADRDQAFGRIGEMRRSEEHTSELQSLMRISYAVFCLKKKKKTAVHELQGQSHKIYIRRVTSDQLAYNLPLINKE